MSPREDNHLLSGGKIWFFQSNWRKLTKDRAILDMVQGFKIPLTQTPVQSKKPREIKLSEKERSAVSEEIDSMLSKGVISKAEPSEDQFLSNVFVRPKPEGKFRFILNLKELNEMVQYLHFKMESLKDVRNMIQKGDYLIKIDLKDAFWSVPVNRKSRRLMRFDWEGFLYEFRTLAFGLGPAPWVFTKLMKVPVSWLRKLGFLLVVYLDDLLISARSKSEALRARDSIIFLLENLGFTINWEKSVLEPTHSLEFLGMTVDTLEMTFTLPERKVFEIVSLCQRTLQETRPSLRDMSKVIGKLYSSSPAIQQAPLQLRYLQHDLIEAQRKGLSYSDTVTLSQNSRTELKWWIFNLELQKGNPIKMQEPDMVLFSDAAQTKGWGAAMEGGPSTGGLWSLEEKNSLHINVLELMAAELAIKSFVDLRPVSSLHIWIDNQVALSYLVKMGGTKNHLLTEISKRIWKFLLEREISLTAGWIPSKLNWRADRESRRPPNSSDWLLHPPIFSDLTSRWGLPTVDCFASRALKQLPNYLSLHADPESQGSNALFHPWNKGFPYLFPPFCLLGHCLKKIRKEKAERVLLIAPLWSNQPWFPSLLELCTDLPVLLPNIENLLTNTEGQNHPLVLNRSLKLGAFLVSGNPSRTREFQTGLPRCSWDPRETQQLSSIGAPGRGGVLGVVNERLIPLLAL